ncbi:MAG: carbamate kinase [Acidobacteriota bacterium]|nr:carbamate kinase [Acidobacteriota bacterium]HNQ81685.1 carbamate kinase [Candidatus Aminicenantes bacterium]MDD8009711.1 carbamate kinase [Acidobacteriota bacterium]MDD8028390.1 carbamate kinase [Acidobacteriota bacterium]MDD8032543.1 carbamate kinase [Acidobacteriota bacterium]
MSAVKRRLALIAFGGNALLSEKQKGTQEEQIANAEDAARLMAAVVRKGYELIIVHGNGPQVGNLLIQQEAAADHIPPYSLDLCDAMTEGSMGYMLERALVNEFRRHSIDKEATTVVTMVLVDKNDPAFAKPTKPVGPFYTAERAQGLKKEKGWTMVEDAGRGWRKVVASPKPIDIVPKWIINDLVQAGRIVIAAGGGGIPVILNGNGLYEGIEAVIDKDYASSLIAREIGVDLFIILTAIDRVCLDFGKPGQRDVAVLSVSEARRFLSEGQFPPGSMGPKIRAAIEYIEAGGKEVLITDAAHLKAALLGRSGTRIVRDDHKTEGA